MSVARCRAISSVFAAYEKERTALANERSGLVDDLLNFILDAVVNYDLAGMIPLAR